MRALIFNIGILCTLWLSGCNYSNTYAPDLKVRPDDIVNSLHDPYNFEDVQFSANKTFGTGGNHDKLIIRLINGENIPQDYMADVPLAQKILKKILPKVQDTDVYDVYEVVFVSRTTNGSTTQTNETAIDIDKK
jgi:hypothetical protein